MNKDWWLVEAGEYVLGTLRGPERDLFEKLLASDTDAQALVMFWESHLSEVDALLLRQEQAKGTIPDSVWLSIEARINEYQRQSESADGATSDTGVHVQRPSPREKGVLTGQVFKSLNRRMRWWQTIGAVSLAGSVVMATLLLTQPDFLFPKTPAESATSVAQANAFNVVAVLSGEDGRQLWAIVADETNGVVRAIALDTPEESSSQSHQLWVVLPENQGVESIGVLPYQNGESATFTITADESIENLRTSGAFAISLEPRGGTDSPAPTGPVISSREITRISEPL